MIEIRFGSYVFTENDILNQPNIYRTMSLLSRGLEYDIFNFTVKSNAIGEQRLLTRLNEWVTTVDDKGFIIDDGVFEEFVPNSPLYIYENGRRKALFYVYDIEPTGSRDNGDEFFNVSCYSEIAMLSKKSHAGGVYSGTTAGTVIADIMGALPYQIAADVAAVPLFGWLPYSQDARDNLEKVLFATGANAMRTSDGTLRFAFNQATEAKQIADGNIFRVFGKMERERWGKVTVVEHSFYQSAFTTEEVILDNSSEVPSGERFYVFEDPHYDYDGHGSGITVVSSGANWARITGVGQLYAKRYIHLQRPVTRTVGDYLTDEEVTVEDETLVSFANIENVMNRLSSYYGGAAVESVDFIVKNEKPGDLIRFLDRRGNPKIGYIQDLDETASSFWRGRANVVTNWFPTGGGNSYSMSQVLTGTGTWRKTDAEALVGHPINIIRFDLIGGGSGGLPGEAGEDGSERKGGRGGAPGAGGECGRVYSITLEGADIPATIKFKCGAGGNPGKEGTDTTINVSGESISSLAGARPATGYIDLFTGIQRCLNGPAGVKGGDGGSYQNIETSTRGQAVTYKDRSWNAGTPGAAAVQKRFLPKLVNREYIIDPNVYVEVIGAPSSTGGAAFGASSTNGSAGSVNITDYMNNSRPSPETVIGIGQAYSGVSTDGADALPIDDYTPDYGSGGAGGNGGGGGGSQNPSTDAGGYVYLNIDNRMVPYAESFVVNDPGVPGLGGSPSIGTKGGAGFITVYM